MKTSSRKRSFLPALWRLFLPVILLLTAMACNNAGTDANNHPATDSTSTASIKDSIPSSPADNTPVDRDDTVTVAGGESVDPADEKDSVTYCYITRFYDKDNHHYIDADFIQFYTGDKAVAAARKYGDAQGNVVDGDTVYSVEGDIYLRNDNKRIRSLVIADDAVYKILHNAPKEVVAVEAPREKLLTRYNRERIYVLTVSKENIVTKIKEQYLP